MTEAKKESIAPSVTVLTRLEKFDGDRQPGQAPVEVIETEETLPLADFLALQNLNGG